MDNCPPANPNDPLNAGGIGSGFEKDKVNPQDVRGGLDYLCSQGWSPVLMTGYLRDTLIRVWSDPDGFIIPSMSQYLWNAADGNGIIIEPSYRFDPNTVGRRPAIFIKRNRVQLKPTGLSGGLIQGYDGNPTIGKGSTSYRETVFIGSHTLFLVGSKAGFTEALVNETVSRMLPFLNVIQNKLNLKILLLSEIGDVSKLEEYSDSFVVPITIAWAFSQVWALTDNSLPMKAPDLSLLLTDSQITLASTIYPN